MHESPEYERGNARREGRWISLATLSSRQVAPQPDTPAEKRRELLGFVHNAVARASAEADARSDDAIARLALAWKVDRIHVRRLIARGEQYLRVLVAVLDGHSYPEVARQLGLTRREIELTVRYIEELLRARGFA
jgi:DNA-binding NarL/FixJ family response regulator